MSDISDTIAAISTAPGEGAVAIIRVSGPRAISAADKIFKCSAPLPSQRKAPALIYGHVVSKGTILDEVLLLIMRSPHSYTRENVVEFQCHGGTISAKRLLRAILSEGVRQADPGEFTRRAFINGRLDMLQAEAVLDLIRAQTDRCATLALEQMEGSLSTSFGNIYNDLLKAGADLEATLDFNDGELPDSFMPGMIQRLNDTSMQMDVLLATWEEGHLIREGALVVISGKPNAGKSTLLNSLLGKDRVIVSPVPGTTRDVVEEQIIINGIPIRLVDTAGLRSSDCSLEQESVRRARMQIEKADINIHVIDASIKLEKNDCRDIALMDQKKTVIVLNKTDLRCVISPDALTGYETIKAQAINNKGIADIKALISGKLRIAKFNVHNFTISERHRAILIDARDNLLEAVGMLKTSDESYIVLAAAKVKAALESMAHATGKTYNQELLDSIFARFCIGK